MKLVSSFKTSYGLIGLRLFNKEHVDKLKSQLNPKVFGEWSILLDPLEKNDDSISVIAKDVPILLSESEIMEKLPEVKIYAKSVKRFNKGGLPIPVVKINLKDTETQNDILSNGFFMNIIFHMPKPFVNLKKQLFVINILTLVTLQKTAEMRKNV